MRLMIVNYEYPPLGGGASNASFFLAKTMARQGHQICVVTSAYGNFRDVSVEDDVRIHRIPAMRKRIDRSSIGQMLCFATSALLYSPSIFRQERVQGVISFFTLPSGLIGYTLKARYGVPYIISLRGGDVPGLEPKLNRTHHRIRFFRRKILGSARAIIANSGGLAKLSTATDPYPVSVIPNGVDCELFHPSAPDTKVERNTPFTILFIGRLQEQKNLGLLLEEIARVVQNGVSAFTLHVVGDGPLRNKMRQRVQQLDIANHIVWHGWITNKLELVSCYQSADCFVNPSLYEGMPNTVLEAMACGLPVVASRIPGNVPLVENCKTGLLFDLEKPQHLGEALVHLICDQSDARRMGATGRARVLDRHSWSTVARAYHQLFIDPP